MHPMGFEPTLPKKTELESVALDHSATDANILNIHTSLTGLEPAIFPLGEGCVTITPQRLFDMNCGVKTYSKSIYCIYFLQKLCWKYRVSIPVPRVCGTRALPIELYPH